MLGGLKRRRILLVLALAAVATAAGLLLFSPRGPKEPVFEGKRLTLWITDAMPDGSLTNRMSMHAFEVIRTIGSNAVPYLLHEFIKPESKWRTSFNRWASKHPAVGFRFQDHQTRFAAAAYGLQILGRDAASALPTLTEYLGDPSRGICAAGAMGSVGELAIPYLLRAIGSTNTLAAENAASCLGHAIRDAESAVQESAVQSLIQMLQHTNELTRWVAALTLGALPSQSPPVVPALTAALSDPVPLVQVHAALALAQKGKPAMLAVPALVRLMTNSDPDLAFAASNAVFFIDPAALPRRGP